MTKKVAVIGADGQLGSELVKVLVPPYWRMYPLSHKQIEIASSASIIKVLNAIGPDFIINTAAFHDLVACERDCVQAMAVNAVGVKNLADWAQKNNCVLVHFSTDYVFGGDTKHHRPYLESDRVAPQSVYSISKVAGELFMQSRLHKYFLIRTSGLYGAAGSSMKGGNFVDKRVEQARRGETIHMVSDQVLSPTYAVNLAENVAGLLKTKAYGLYHMTSMGSCSWYEFTEEILRLTGLKTKVMPVKTDDAKAGVIRPRYSVLSKSKLTKLGINGMNRWKKNLKLYFEEKG